MFSLFCLVSNVPDIFIHTEHTHSWVIQRTIEWEIQIGSKRDRMRGFKIVKTETKRSYIKRTQNRWNSNRKIFHEQTHISKNNPLIHFFLFFPSSIKKMGESSCFVFQRGQKMIILGVILPFFKSMVNVVSFTGLAGIVSIVSVLGRRVSFLRKTNWPDKTARQIQRYRDSWKIELRGGQGDS